MVWKYQNEISPIFYYWKKLKTSEKLLKILDIQPPDWKHPYWMTRYYYWNVARYFYQEHPDEHDRQGDADGEGDHSHGVGGGAGVLGPDQAAVQDDAAVQEQGDTDGGNYADTVQWRDAETFYRSSLLFDGFPPSFLMIFLRD